MEKFTYEGEDPSTMADETTEFEMEDRLDEEIRIEVEE